VNSLKNKEICLISLKDLGTWCGGGTPSKQVSAYWENGTIPWVSPKDMKVDHIRGAEDTITEKAVKESATNLLPAGSVLIVTRSGILRHTFPVAVTDVPVTINQDLKALVPSEGVDAKYVAFGLRAFSHEILHQCSKQGTTVNSIETKELLRFQIPLFSTEVQTRIVAEIEKQFSRLDEAVANLKRVKANLKRYKAAVLKAAVEGKLTEEWRRGAIHRAQSLAEYDNQGAINQGAINQGAINRAPTKPIETGAELLGRILAERRKAAGKGKYKEPVGPDTSGLPELPVGWVWASVCQLGVIKGGKRLPAGHVYSDVQTSYPYIRVTDFDQFGIRTSALQYLAKETHQEIRRYIITADDIYISIAGTIGLVGQVPAQLSGANLTENAAKITEIIHTDPKYLIYWLASPTGIAHIARSTIATTQAKLSLFRIEQIPVPFPPLAEQHQIVAEVERCLSVVAGAEAQVDANLRRADRLRQSILKQAFSGQLVPQDPNDEPASLLLERIRGQLVAPVKNIKEKPLPRRNAKSAIKVEPKAGTSDNTSLDSVLTAILGLMQPGQDYSRADLADALGLTTGRWNAAIQELKRRGQVRQVGEKRGARYLISR